MIPKIIHYVWLSGDEIPQTLRTCMNSWKEVLPDYEVICWDKNRFDITSIPFVEEACSIKKWAFACDYIRLYALYTEGGIYLDSDVLLNSTFEPYLEYDFFSSVEYHPSIVEYEQSQMYLQKDGTAKISGTPIPGIGIQAAVLGSAKGHPFIKECMDYYTGKHFINADGTLYDKIIAPSIYAMIAEKYGFKYIDKLQNLKENILILPSSIIASTRSSATNESIAIHCCAGSWREDETKSIMSRIVDKLLLVINIIRQSKNSKTI